MGAYSGILLHTLAYSGHILGISWAYLGHIMGISRAYLVHILGISWAYLGHILGISGAYLGRAVWSLWQEILGSDGAGDIGNLQAVGDEEYQNEREDREGGQEETDSAISQEEEED